MTLMDLVPDVKTGAPALAPSAALWIAVASVVVMLGLALAVRLLVGPTDRAEEPRKKRSGWLVAGVAWCGDGDLLIRLQDGRAFRGGSTVWHRYPDGERATTSEESALCDIWTRETWKRSAAAARDEPRELQ